MSYHGMTLDEIQKFSLDIIKGWKRIIWATSTIHIFIEKKPSLASGDNSFHPAMCLQNKSVRHSLKISPGRGRWWIPWTGAWTVPNWSAFGIKSWADFQMSILPFWNGSLPWEIYHFVPQIISKRESSSKSDYTSLQKLIFVLKECLPLPARN